LLGAGENSELAPQPAQLMPRKQPRRLTRSLRFSDKDQVLGLHCQEQALKALKAFLHPEKGSKNKLFVDFQSLPKMKAANC